MKEFLENLNRYWVTPVVAIVGGLLGIYFTIVKDRLEAEATNLSNTATRIETELKQREFNNSLKFQMYGEVKDAIAKKDKEVQSAVLIIVNEMLADDSLFRDKLITLMLSSPNTDKSVLNEQKTIESKAEEFKQEEKQTQRDKFTIDVFYLEDVLQEAEPRAKKIVEILSQHYPGYQIRQRKLPRNINAQSGYRISANEIRFENEEESIAHEVLQIIQAQKVFPMEQPRLRKISYHTPNYISIFVRNM